MDVRRKISTIGAAAVLLVALGTVGAAFASTATPDASPTPTVSATPTDSGPDLVERAQIAAQQAEAEAAAQAAADAKAAADAAAAQLAADAAAREAVPPTGWSTKTLDGGDAGKQEVATNCGTAGASVLPDGTIVCAGG